MHAKRVVSILGSASTVEKGHLFIVAKAAKIGCRAVARWGR